MKVKYYRNALKQADAVDNEIIKALNEKKNFLVEAGAGSGKTYSLMKVLAWLHSNKAGEYASKQQNVACITYTNVAVDEIKRRLPEKSIAVPSTIHAFAWGAISRFQSDLIKLVAHLMPPRKNDGSDVYKVDYYLGKKYVQDGCFYLGHNDVIELFCQLLANAKFRTILQNKYPVILIDEYQDTDKDVMDCFIKYFIRPQKGMQFGLFGDHWQTIYSDKNVCGKVSDRSLKVITKKVNFRSQKHVVDVLNMIRPSLPQIPARLDNDGMVKVILTNNYCGVRRSGAIYSGELAEKDFADYVKSTSNQLRKLGWNDDFKVLMLTHKLLASQQNYLDLLTLLGSDFKDKDDIHLLFFMDVVEPIYSALKEKNTNLLYEVLKENKRRIASKQEKIEWIDFGKHLQALRSKNISDVMAFLMDSDLIVVPEEVKAWYESYKSEPDKKYHVGTIKNFYDIPYAQVINAIKFFEPDAMFSTEHGVKGEEYDSVLYVIGRGWNQYAFDTQLYLDEKCLKGKDLARYQRNRNLFYVCCSRAKKNLALLITVETNAEFRQYLSNVFGEANIVEYEDFVKV